MKKLLFLTVGVALLLSPLALQAQWAVSPHVVISIPENDFANIGETGGGFGIKVTRSLSSLANGFALRGDFAFLTFGRETTLVFDPFGQLIPLESRNEGLRLTFGPQYKIGGRSLKVYAGANGGVYFFRKNITTRFNTFSGTRFFQDFEDNNLALGWNLTAGLQYDIGLGPWLDIAFEYQTMHNLPESVENESDSNVAIPDITAHEYTIKAGVIFFLGR